MILKVGLFLGFAGKTALEEALADMIVDTVGDANKNALVFITGSKEQKVRDVF